MQSFSHSEVKRVLECVVKMLRPLSKERQCEVSKKLRQMCYIAQVWKQILKCISTSLFKNIFLACVSHVKEGPMDKLGKVYSSFGNLIYQISLKILLFPLPLAHGPYSPLHACLSSIHLSPLPQRNVSLDLNFPQSTTM